MNMYLFFFFFFSPQEQLEDDKLHSNGGEALSHFDFFSFHESLPAFPPSSLHNKSLLSHCHHCHHSLTRWSRLPFTTHCSSFPFFFQRCLCFVVIDAVWLLLSVDPPCDSWYQTRRSSQLLFSSLLSHVLFSFLLLCLMYPYYLMSFLSHLSFVFFFLLFTFLMFFLLLVSFSILQFCLIFVYASISSSLLSHFFSSLFFFSFSYIFISLPLSLLFFSSLLD